MGVVLCIMAEAAIVNKASASSADSRAISTGEGIDTVALYGRHRTSFPPGPFLYKWSVLFLTLRNHAEKVVEVRRQAISCQVHCADYILFFKIANNLS